MMMIVMMIMNQMHWDGLMTASTVLLNDSLTTVTPVVLLLVAPSQTTLLKSVILSVTLPLSLRACLGPLPFSVAFAFTEYMKVGTGIT